MTGFLLLILSIIYLIVYVGLRESEQITAAAPPAHPTTDAYNTESSLDV